MEWIKGISPITFPGLGISIDPASGFTVGPLHVNFYGVLIALGLLLAVVYGWKRANQFGIKQDDLTDGVLWIVPFAIICARLYYCAFKWEEEGYGADPLRILYIWKGGLAIYGGVIGAALGTVIHCLVKKMKITAVLDLVGMGFLIGQSIGRWGNFFNREAFGAETDSFLRMGLQLTADRKASAEMLYYHPTFFYESLWNAAGFLLLHFLSKRRKYDGQIALGYVAWYGLGRTFVEALRTDSLYIGPFRVSQLLAAVSCFGAVVVLLLMMFKEHSPEKLFVNQVAARAAAAEETEEIAEEAVEEVTEEEISETENTEEE